MAKPRKKMTVKQFREDGYLQELNRQFLHPLGLALEVVRDPDGKERFGLVWDSREDSEGFIFDEELIDPAKADRVLNEQMAKKVSRHGRLGYSIQPVPGAHKE